MWFAPENSDTPDGGEVSDLDDQAFNAMEDNVERLAAETAKRTDPEPFATRHDPSAPIRTEKDFKQAVRDAIDELPDGAQEALENVVITVSDEGQGARLREILRPHLQLHLPVLQTRSWPGVQSDHDLP
jgi:hypothetical protein